MKSYPSYTDSGILWINNIPSHWGLPKLKYHYSYKKGVNGQKLTKEFIGNNPGNYPVYSGTTKKSGMLGKTNEFEFNFKFPVIFLSTVGSDTTVMSTKVLIHKFSLSQNCLIMIPNTDVNSIYINYFLGLHFKYLRDLLPVILKEGHRSVGMIDLDTYEIVLPPESEQSQIVSFLDNKTQKIDDLIQKTEKKIKLLKEKRTSLINHCVTKGLNPNVEMKDSGVEWIGDIPSHWDKIKVKYLGRIKSGDGLESSLIEPEGEFPVYGGNGVMGYYSNFNSDIPILVIGRVGEKCGNVHYEDSKVWINDNSLIFHPNEKVLSIKYLFNSFTQRDFNLLRNQNTQPLITGTLVKNEYIPFPPESEQTQIVEYLNEKTQKIDSTIEKETQRIDLLKEYRQSLISEVVTGKVDVRDYNG
jgi:type I restriction enzyme, S subunit